VSVEGPKLYGWENDRSGETKPRPMPNDADSILLMASRCAALAVVKVGSHAVENIAVASAHLTGGRFDDDLIGLPREHRDYEKIQKVEKIKQVGKLAAALTASGYRSIIMGDFNGPDDFDIQWWKVLTAPWPATHPFLGSLFGGKEGNEQVLGPIRKEFAGDNADLSKLHTYSEESYWSTNTSLPSENREEIIAELARFEGVYRLWMVGMHAALRNKGWMPLATSQDFTQSFGKVRGTTSKFGGMIDFFYASPGFVGNLSCKLPTPDFSAGADFSDGEIDQLARVKECPKVRDNEKPGIVAMNLDVVKGVLKRSTDHAPVLAEIMIDR